MNNDGNDFWNYFVDLNPQFVLNMLEVVLERLKEEKKEQDINILSKQIEEIKIKYNIAKSSKFPFLKHRNNINELQDK